MTVYPTKLYWPPSRPRAAAAHGGQTGIVVFGTLGTILLHSLLIAPVLWHTGGVTPPIERQFGLPSANPADERETLTVFFVDESGTPRGLDDSGQYALARPVSPNAALRPIAIPDIAPIPQLVQFTDERVDDSLPGKETDGRAAHTMMFGRYMGQLSARIDRAWLRPRAPIGAASFNCRVQIVQDRSGVIQEITLQRCNGDYRWQLSLVHAIQDASPLPAPPDPAVFSNLLALEFNSEAFNAGTSAQGYETATPAAVPTAAKPLIRVEESSRRAGLTQTRQPVSTQLTITGPHTPKP